MAFANYNMMNMFMNTGIGNIGTCSGLSGLGGFGSFGNIFGRCDGSLDYNAMAGFAIGSSFLQIGACAVNQIISAKRENSQANIETNLKTLNKQIDNKVKQLGCDSLEEAQNYDIEDDTAGKKVTDLKNELEGKKNSLDKYKSDTEYKSIMQAYTDANKQDPKPANINELKQAYDEASQALIEKEKLEKEIKKLEESTLPAAEKAKEAREKVIESVQSELKKLVEQRDELQGEKNNKVLEKADGNKFNRVSTAELNEKFIQTKDGKLATAPDATFTKRDFFRAVNEYRTASDSKKEEWKNKIKLIYDNMSGDEKSRKIVEAFDTVMGKV